MNNNNNNNIDMCEYCLGYDLCTDYSEGNVVCRNCGTVKEMYIQMVSYNDTLDNEICYKDTDIDDYGTNQNLPESILHTAMLYNQIVLKNKIYKGCNVVGIKAACTFLACKEHNVTRTHEEICKIYNISSQLLSKCLKFSETYVNNIKLVDNDTSEKNEIVNSEDLIRRYLNDFVFEKEIKKMFLKCFFETHDRCIGLFEGKSPKTITCSIISYLFENRFPKLNYKKKDVSIKLHISMVTLNKTIKLIVHHFKN
jgi:transcription initiation factor TFIIB